MVPQRRLVGDTGEGREVIMGDVDGDGDLDMYLVTENRGLEQNQNKLYINDRYGTFEEAAATQLPMWLMRRAMVGVPHLLISTMTGVAGYVCDLQPVMARTLSSLRMVQLSAMAYHQ